MFQLLLRNSDANAREADCEGILAETVALESPGEFATRE